MSVALPAAAGSRTWRLAVGFAVFQAAWFACVIGAARAASGWGVGAVAAALVWLLAASDRRRVDGQLVLVAIATGVVWDTLLLRAGVVDYASPGPVSDLAPAWILALWALWGVVLREPLRWLHGRPVAAALLGGVGGALSYAAAARLGACRFADPTLAMVVLAAGWALITPLQLALARRWDAKEPAR